MPRGVFVSTAGEHRRTVDCGPRGCGVTCQCRHASTTSTLLRATEAHQTRSGESSTRRRRSCSPHARADLPAHVAAAASIRTGWNAPARALLVVTATAVATAGHRDLAARRQGLRNEALRPGRAELEKRCWSSRASRIQAALDVANAGYESRSSSARTSRQMACSTRLPTWMLLHLTPLMATSPSTNIR